MLPLPEPGQPLLALTAPAEVFLLSLQELFFSEQLLEQSFFSLTAPAEVFLLSLQVLFFSEQLLEQSFFSLTAPAEVFAWVLQQSFASLPLQQSLLFAQADLSLQQSDFFSVTAPGLALASVVFVSLLHAARPSIRLAAARIAIFFIGSDSLRCCERFEADGSCVGRGSIPVPSPQGCISFPRVPPMEPGSPQPEDRVPGLLVRARALPAVPGVYLMKDAAGVVLYVGKANRLPDRVSSYFLPSTDLGPRKQPLIGLVAEFDVIPCEGEWEALLLEARLVKDLKPRFNARLLDDKTYPYLAVTIREEFPGVYITRDPGHERFRGARVYGPFTSGADLRHAIQLLQRVFQFRTCDLDLRSEDPRNLDFRPCILANIDQCTAPCANRISATRYRQDVERFCRFLESRRADMLRELRAEMEEASAARRYEAAAVLRDQIQAIEKLDERERRGREGEFDWQPEVTISAKDPRAGCRSLQRALGLETEVRCVEAVDIAHLGGGDTVGSLVCFVDGRPFKDRYRRFQVRTVSNDDYQAIREVVSRRFRDSDRAPELLPDVLLIDGGPGQLAAALEALAQCPVRPRLVIGLSKREELIHMPDDPEPMRLGRSHAGLHLCQAIRDEAHRFAQHYHHLLRRKRMLPPASTRPAKRRKGPPDDAS